MNTALHNYVAFGLRGFARQLQTVAHNVGNAVENFGCLVIMRQYNGVFLCLQRVDCFDIGREKRPLDGGNNRRDACVKWRHIAG